MGNSPFPRKAQGPSPRRRGRGLRDPRRRERKRSLLVAAEGASWRVVFSTTVVYPFTFSLRIIIGIPIARGGSGGGRAAKQTEMPCQTSAPEGQGSHRSRHKGPSVKGTWFSKLRHPRVWARNRRGGKEAANPASAERHVRRGPCRTPGPGTCPPRARLLPPPRDHRCSGPEVTCTPSGAAGWGAGGVSSPLRGICRFGASEKVF